MIVDVWVCTIITIVLTLLFILLMNLDIIYLLNPSCNNLSCIFYPPSSRYWGPKIISLNSSCIITCHRSCRTPWQLKGQDYMSVEVYGVIGNHWFSANGIYLPYDCANKSLYLIKLSMFYQCSPHQFWLFPLHPPNLLQVTWPNLINVCYQFYKVTQNYQGKEISCSKYW